MCHSGQKSKSQPWKVKSVIQKATAKSEVTTTSLGLKERVVFEVQREINRERERELFFEFTWLSMQLVSRFQRQYSLLHVKYCQGQNQQNQMSRWLLQKQKRLALQASGGLLSEQAQGMALHYKTLM